MSHRQVIEMADGCGPPRNHRPGVPITNRACPTTWQVRRHRLQGVTGKSQIQPRKCDEGVSSPQRIFNEQEPPLQLLN
jgi:hypothetical protein